MKTSEYETIKYEKDKEGGFSLITLLEMGYNDSHNYSLRLLKEGMRPAETGDRGVKEWVAGEFGTHEGRGEKS